LTARANTPARNEYALNIRAKRSAKLPICDMGKSGPNFQKLWFQASFDLRVSLSHCGAGGYCGRAGVGSQVLGLWIRVQMCIGM